MMLGQGLLQNPMKNETSSQNGEGANKKDDEMIGDANMKLKTE